MATPHTSTAASSETSALEARRAQLLASFPRQDRDDATQDEHNGTEEQQAQKEAAEAATIAAAKHIVSRHTAALTRYNDVKDAAQGIMGLLAERRGARVGEVMEEFGMGDGD